MKNKPTLAQKLQYAFDNTLVSGSSAIITWLALLSTILVILFGIIYAVTGLNMPDTPGMDFWEASWQALMRSLDSGMVSGDQGWAFRLLGLLVSISGVFILSTLIGVLTTGLDSKLDDLRKGRSLVLESGHTLIMGWSDKIFHIVEQLIIANANKPNSRIVILAQRDKDEMEDDLKARIPNTRTTRIICRTGSPLTMDDIGLVNPDDARSIIILSPDNEDPDTHVIKSVLALTNNPNRGDKPYHIVAELDDDKNMEAALLVGQDEACYVRTSSMLARIAAQTCRQSGLSMVYSDLLDYSGDEIYFQQEPALTGKTYREALSSYDDSAVIGIQRASNGEILLNPPMDTALEAGDQVIAISADDDTIRLSRHVSPVVDEALIVHTQLSAPQVENNILLGWNAKGTRIIGELDKYVAPGSSLSVVAEGEGIADELLALQNSLHNLRIELTNDRITRRSALDKLDLHGSRNVVVLSYANLPIQEADAKTLITLLHLRNIAKTHHTRFNIVSEMSDIKNRELAEVARADDFIIGDNLTSLVLTQLSETKALQGVFDCLFNAEGAEIYLHPASDYVQTGAEMDFHTLLEAAAQRNETAIGYRLMQHSRDPRQRYGIRLNPPKHARFTLSREDRIIVIAND